MSGFCGLVRLDGAPADLDQLGPVHQALAFRGQDGDGMWAEGRVAFGFRLRATTPEAARERQPWRHGPSDCTIVADARLDNRDDLAAALGLSVAGRGDAELILHAFLKWGDEAPQHLLGDYAFALWDGRHNRLLAVRDPLGMRQLHYAHLPGKLLVFATDDHVLLQHAAVPKRLNEVRIADFLEDLEGADLVSTFYRDVHRLPPAHLLKVEGAKVAKHRYWSLQPQAPLALRSDRDYAEAFLSTLEQAVTSRLRSHGEAATMLSGGLDSSAVSALAARLSQRSDLRTFSAVEPSDPMCIETRMIRAVQRFGQYQSVEVTAEELIKAPPFAARNPFDSYMALIGRVYAAAQRSGCNVMLDGVASDVVLAHRALVPRLLKQGQWKQAWTECQGEADFWQVGRRPSALLLNYLQVALVPDWVRRSKSDCMALGDHVWPRSPVLRSTFARRIRIAERRRDLRRAAPTPDLPYPVDRAGIILHPNLTVARERYDRVASIHGIEARDPFLDLRLITFAISLPAHQLLRSGWPKFILREAMSGILPEEVRWRKSKSHLGGKFICAAMKAEQPARRQALQAAHTALGEWVRPDLIDEADGTFLNYGPRERVVHLAQWLQASGFVDQ